MTAVDATLEMLRIRSQYKSIVCDLGSVGHLMREHSSMGFGPEIMEWLKTSHYELYADVCCIVCGDTIEFAFRSEEIAAEFKLRFL
jgi:hypothetical protein